MWVNGLKYLIPPGAGGAMNFKIGDLLVTKTFPSIRVYVVTGLDILDYEVLAIDTGRIRRFRKDFILIHFNRMASTPWSRRRYNIESQIRNMIIDDNA